MPEAPCFRLEISLWNRGSNSPAADRFPPSPPVRLSLLAAGWKSVGLAVAARGFCFELPRSFFGLDHQILTLPTVTFSATHPLCLMAGSSSRPLSASSTTVRRQRRPPRSRGLSLSPSPRSELLLHPRQPHRTYSAPLRCVSFGEVPPPFPQVQPYAQSVSAAAGEESFARMVYTAECEAAINEQIKSVAPLSWNHNDKFSRLRPLFPLQHRVQCELCLSCSVLLL